MKQLLTDPDGTISREEFLRGFRIVLGLVFVSVAVYFGSIMATRSMPVHTTGMLPFLGVPLFFIIVSSMYFAFCVFAKRLRGKGYSNGWVSACLLAFFFAISARFTAQQVINTGAAEAASADWLPLALKVAFVGFIALHAGLLIWMTLVATSKD